MDFSLIIPKMREAITDYRERKAAQGRPMTVREATVRWLDRYYDSWLRSQIGAPAADHSGATGSEKRRHPRIPIEISAYYRVLWTPQRDSPTDDALTEKARIENISAGGLYFVTGRPYPISTLVEIQFELPGVPDSIVAFAMVVWRKETSVGRFGHGLHFSHIEAEMTDLIQEAIMERLLDAPVVPPPRGDSL